MRAVLYREHFAPRFNVNRYATVRRTRGKELVEGLARSRFHALVRRAGGESSLMNNAYVLRCRYRFEKNRSRMPRRRVAVTACRNFGIAIAVRTVDRWISRRLVEMAFAEHARVPL